MRAVLVGIVALLLLLAVALAMAPGFVDWQAAKPRLEAELSRAVGRPVAVDGALSLSLLPRPRVTAEGLRVANRAQGSEPELLRVARLELRLAPLPLLSGRFEVQSLRLVRPVLLLERLEDGNGNWIAPRSAPLVTEPGRLLDAVSLEAVELRDGEVVWRDHPAGREERLSGIDALLAADSLRGPLSSQGRLLYRGREVAFDVGLGRFNRQGRQPLNLQVALPEAAGAELRLTGRLEEGGDEWRLAGRIQLRGADAGALLRELGTEPPPSLRLDQALEVGAELSWDDRGLAFDGLEATLGTARLVGRAGLRPGPAFDLVLAARYLDLDALLGSGEPEWPRLRLPDALSGAVSLEVERMLLRGQSLRGLRIAGRFDGGGLLLDEAAAQLPGGARLALQGRWTADSETPRFAGRVEARSTNLRAQLAWLGLEPPGVDSDRLRRFSLEAALDATPELVTLTEATLDLDLTRVAGGLALAPRRRPAIGLRLEIDRLNLDAYHDPAALPGREILTRFDANLELRAERLILGGRHADGLLLDGTLQRGDLELRALEIEDLTGARLQASGGVSGLADALPQLTDGSLQLEAADSERLLRGLKLQAPPLLQRLGAFSLAGSLSGNTQALEVNLDLAARDAVAFLALRLEEEGGGWRIAQGRLDLDELPAAAAAELLGYADAGWPARLGRLRLESSFSMDDGVLAHDTQLRVGEARLRLAGRSEDLWGAAPRSRAEASLTHPDAAGLLRQLFDGDAALPSAPLTLQAAVEASPSRLVAEAIEGRLGDAPFGGRLQQTLGEARPRLEVDLQLGSLPGRALLMPLLGAVPPGDALLDGEGRWSRAPLPLSGLLDGEVSARLALDRLELGDSALADVVLELSREAGVLSLKRFTGRLGAARIALEGRMAARPPELLEASLSLQAKELPVAALWGLEEVGGGLDLTVTARTSGRNVAELVAGLSGAGRLTGLLRLPPPPPVDGGALEAAFRRLLGEMQAEEAVLSAHLTAVDGSVEATLLRLAGARRALVVEGVLADLPRRRSDFTARLESAVGSRQLARLRVSGSFAEPEVRLEFGATADATNSTFSPRLSASPAGAALHRP